MYVLTGFQAAEKRRHVSTLWKMKRWSLDTILLDQDDSSALVLAANLMAMDVHNVFHIDADKILPVDTREHMVSRKKNDL